MSTDVEPRKDDHTHDTDPAGWTMALSVGSLLAAVGSLAYISVAVLFPDASPREDYLNPLGVAGCVIATCGLMLMGMALLRVRTDLPAWAILASAAGLFFTAANAWFFSTGVVAIAEGSTDEVFDDMLISGWVLAMAAPKMLLCLVGFLGIAVAGWRRGSIPRTASILLALAAPAALIPPHPPGALLASLAFFLIAGRSTDPRRP